ncbi:hypothetical protein AB0I53_19385 [Saccharopolyspora sp. NPDC050389]|uniref:hypothetical protein n=1 Tax=Saccharopolyspora sp. NPDC050389 TaxID=3155516 RepID=UPI0033C31D16
MLAGRRADLSECRPAGLELVVAIVLGAFRWRLHSDDVGNTVYGIAEFHSSAGQAVTTHCPP